MEKVLVHGGGGGESLIREEAVMENSVLYLSPLGARNGVAIGLPDACLVSDPAAVLGLPSDGLNADQTVTVWKPDQASCDATPSWQPGLTEHKRLQTTIPHAGFLILRLRSFPAWRVAVNGQPPSSLPQRDDGLIAVPVPRGPIELTVDWITTPDVVAGRCLSALAVLLLIGLWLLERKLRRPRLS
jgi:hypothetical protein